MIEPTKKHTRLLQQSSQLLIRYKKLIALPLLSSLLTLLLLALILTPFLHYERELLLDPHPKTATIVSAYVIFFFLLVASRQISLFFNLVMIFCIRQHFNKKPIRLLSGLHAASTHSGLLSLFNLYVSTVGIFINLFQSVLLKLPGYRKMASGLRWSIIGKLSLPTIMSNRTGPINTLKQSAALIRKTWGAQLRPHSKLLPRFGSIPFLLLAYCLAILPAVSSLFIKSHYSWVGVSLTVILVRIISSFSEGIYMILAAALYYYASTGRVVTDFNEDCMRRAFRVVHKD